MKTIQVIALILTIIGALNWGMIGLFDFDFVTSIFGGRDSIVTMLIFDLVGIAGIVNIWLLVDLLK